MADGVGTLQSLTALGGANGGSPSLSALTASGVASPAGVASLSAVTVPSAGIAPFLFTFNGADGAVVLLSAITAAGEQAGTNATGAGELKSATGTGVSEAATTGVGAPSLQEITAAGYSTDIVDAVLEEVTAAGVNLTGSIAAGDAFIKAVQAEATALGDNPTSGAGVLRRISATGVAAHDTAGEGTATISTVRAVGLSLNGGVASGLPSLKVVESAGVGYPLGVASGDPSMQKLRTNAFGETEIDATYRTWVMNLANEAITEYTNSAFNSFAYFNGKLYGAGPNGLIELNDIATDRDAPINWTIRTGMMDDKKPNLKRLNDLLLSLRYNGPVRVRVWTDEETYYDYTLSNFRADLLHQVRVPTGKGMRSRYYQIEISSLNGATVQIDSLQVPMEPVTRRVG